MKTTVYTLRVNDYFPELCNITFPWIKAYADRIGAKFEVVEKRAFPEWNPTYEKLQIHELGKDNDWNILIDADMMINRNFPDVTKFSLSSVGIYMSYDASFLFEPDQYFARDGRQLGIATNFMSVHSANHDIWEPLEFGFEQAKIKSKRLHILDEYCVSRNVAKFGLKVSGVYQGTSQPAPRKVTEDNLQDDLIHLDVSTNSKEDVLQIAQRVNTLWNQKFS